MGAFHLFYGGAPEGPAGPELSAVRYLWHRWIAGLLWETDGTYNLHELAKNRIWDVSELEIYTYPK